MGSTSFFKCKKDNGLAIEVEYEIVEHGEDNYDNPGHICDGGGSGPVVQINDEWPDTPEFMALETQRLSLVTDLDSPLHDDKSIFVQAWGRLKLIWLVHKIDRMKATAKLTDDERWRWESVIAEQVASEPPEFDEGDWRDMER